jgi:hypothetical protein
MWPARASKAFERKRKYTAYILTNPMFTYTLSALPTAIAAHIGVAVMCE